MTLVPRDPTELGAYRLTGRLGSGGFGVIYSAESPNGSQVAIKLLNSELSADPSFRSRLAQEAEAMARVRSDRTAQVIEVVTEGPDAFLVMELVDGATLDRHVESNGPFKGPELWFVSEGLTEGLAAIHRAGIVHRDLKPANIMYGAGGIKILDFGISTVLGDNPQTRTGTFMASAAWISPEQIRDERASSASDVFMLGLILGFAATGEHPFGSGRSDAVMFRIAHQEPNVGGVSEPLRDVVVACLQKDPLLRPTVDALAQFFASGGNDGLVVGGGTGPDGTLIVGGLAGSSAVVASTEETVVEPDDVGPDVVEPDVVEPVVVDESGSADDVGFVGDGVEPDGGGDVSRHDSADDDADGDVDGLDGPEVDVVAGGSVGVDRTRVVAARTKPDDVVEVVSGSSGSKTLVGAIVGLVALLAVGGVMFAALGGDKPEREQVAVESTVEQVVGSVSAGSEPGDDAVDSEGTVGSSVVATSEVVGDVTDSTDGTSDAVVGSEDVDSEDADSSAGAESSGSGSSQTVTVTTRPAPQTTQAPNTTQAPATTQAPTTTTTRVLDFYPRLSLSVLENDANAPGRIYIAAIVDAPVDQGWHVDADDSGLVIQSLTIEGVGFDCEDKAEYRNGGGSLAISNTWNLNCLVPGSLPAGVYEVKVTVENGLGLSATATVATELDRPAANFILGMNEIEWSNCGPACAYLSASFGVEWEQVIPINAYLVNETEGGTTRSGIAWYVEVDSQGRSVFHSEIGIQFSSVEACQNAVIPITIEVSHEFGSKRIAMGASAGVNDFCG